MLGAAECITLTHDLAMRKGAMGVVRDGRQGPHRGCHDEKGAAATTVACEQEAGETGTELRAWQGPWAGAGRSSGNCAGWVGRGRPGRNPACARIRSLQPPPRRLGAQDID